MIGHVAITGGTGYIGRRTAAAALARGWSVTVLSRSARGLPEGATHCPWSLGEPIPDSALSAALPVDRQALIHLAHDWANSGATPGDEGGLNARGTLALLDSARGLGVGRFVFVSSQSARQDAANLYGRVKWRIEQLLTGPNESAARVGLVYGGPRQAMFGLLCKLTGIAPVLPMIDPWRTVQPIHIDEVAEGLCRMAERGGAGWTGLAAPLGVPFGDFLKALARAFSGKALPVIPIPVNLALAACAITARIPFIPTVDRERVLGLAGTLPMDCGRQLDALGLAVVPLDIGLRREPASRKAILTEGRVLARYLLGGEPGSLLPRRYARSIALAQQGAIPLSGLFRLVPALLCLVEPLGGASPLAQRLRLMTSLVETSPRGESVLASASRTRRVLGLAARLALDAVVLPLRLLHRR